MSEPEIEVTEHMIGFIEGAQYTLRYLEDIYPDITETDIWNGFFGEMVAEDE